MFQLKKTDFFLRKAKKFFKKHPDLIQKFKKITEQLSLNPFENSLKTHKLSSELSEYYSCSLTFEYRIILTIEIKQNEIILVNIGTHDEVY